MASFAWLCAALSPTQTKAAAHSAWAHLRQGKDIRAARANRTCIELDPKDQTAHYQLGSLRC